MVLGLILQLYPMASKTWLKDALHFTFWDRMFARICFYKSSFFIRSFRYQDSDSYYLVLATAKVSKIWKRTSLDVYFLISKSQDRAINYQWIIQPKLIACPSDAFFLNLVITPVILFHLTALTDLILYYFNFLCYWSNWTKYIFVYIIIIC